MWIYDCKKNEALDETNTVQQLYRNILSVNVNILIKKIFSHKFLSMHSDRYFIEDKDHKKIVKFSRKYVIKAKSILLQT